MRLLFASLGGHGHLIPLLPLAVAARESGHDVVVATAEAFHPFVLKAGLAALPAGIPVRDAVAEAAAACAPPAEPAGLPAPGRGLSALTGGSSAPGSSAAAAPAPAEAQEQAPEPRPGDIDARVFGCILPRRSFAELGWALRDFKPELVVYEAMNVGALFAARAAGIPAVSHATGRLSRGPAWSALGAAWSDTAAQLDVVPPAADDPHFLGDACVDICPPSFRATGAPKPRRRLALRPGGWSQDAPLPAIVRTDRARPLVYLTFGTAFADPYLLRQAADGLARLPVDVLAVTGPRVARIEGWEPPPNVAVERWVPQSAVLPHASLVVSHGGSGTVLGAFAAGLPQLVAPRGANQFENAAALVALGAGRQIRPGELSADAVEAQARALLADESARAVSRGLAAEIADMPGPEEVLRELEDVR